MHSHTNRRLPARTLALLSGAVLSMACSSGGSDGYNELETPATGGASNGASGTDASAATSADGSGGATGNATAANVGSIGATSTGTIDITGQQPDPEDEVPCAASNTPTVLQDIVLAFVFDVSASMGNGQFAYFSRTLKWDPVVAATKAFFEDPNSNGLAATLTFFPNELAPIAGGNQGGPGGGSNGAECVADDYATPDVPLTDLPSALFSQAIDAVTPPDDSTWRLGTPTLPAYEGTVQAIQAMQAANPAAKYSIVVVTDGMPALCPGIQDDIGPVAQAAAAVADQIPTYVIGVENPATDEDPNPPDTVSALNELAVAGGTDMAYLINTDDPTQTTTQFKEIVETIREFSISCSLAIPEPDAGQTFDKDKVNVGYSSPSLGDIPFTYDPTCSEANAWHYDNEDTPTSIEICDQVCDAIRVQQDEGDLSIELGCKRREPA